MIFFKQILFVKKGYSLKDNLMTNSVIVVTIYVIKVSHGAVWRYRGGKNNRTINYTNIDKIEL